MACFQAQLRCVERRSAAVPTARRTVVLPRSSVVRSPLAVSCSLQKETGEAIVSRRDSMLAGLSFGLLLTASPAQAFLGFGDSEKIEKEYNDETAAILAEVKDILAGDRGAPDREDKVKVARKDINSWVAKYRREPKVSGRPSYGNTYSALNALAGHFNSFGPQAPIPKKRLERLEKELSDAETLLGRGR